MTLETIQGRISLKEGVNITEDKFKTLSLDYAEHLIHRYGFFLLECISVMDGHPKSKYWCLCYRYNA